MDNNPPITPLQPTPVPPMQVSPLPKKSNKLLLFIIIAAVLIIFGAAAVVIVGLAQKNATQAESDAVKTNLIAASEAMEKAVANGDGYPLDLATVYTATDQIQLSGGGSYDGTAYCINGQAADASEIWHIESVSKEPRVGSCKSATDLPAPGKVDRVSTALIGSTQLGLNWQPASYASQYLLQCASDEAFTNIVENVKTEDLKATCKNLNSNTTYFVRVRAENSKMGEWSKTLKVTTQNL